MKRKKQLAGMMAAALAVVTLGTTIASGVPAPDGATKAEDTAAAANGAYDEWKKEWETISNDWTQVSMTPGADATKMNFAWYSKKDGTTGFRYGKNENLSDATEVSIQQTDAQEGYYSNKVTLENLESNTTYYYQVDGKEIESFSTKDSSRFSFIFVGDPQIGSSNNEKAKKPEDIAKPSFKKAQYDSVQNDSFNWANTLNQAMIKQDGNISFILSAGDQIQTNAKKVKNNTVSEMEYAGYLSPEVLKSVPVATSVGNHDADNPNYQYHFNIPNLSNLGDNGYVGGDYYFTYGDALFIMLNTQDTNVEEHGKFIKQTVEANQDAKWKIVTLHQDIYGSAEHSNEPEIANLRYALVPYFQENNIDVVFTGHDHAYSRSQLLKDGVKTVTYTDDEFDEQLEKDLDAGDNPGQLTTAPGNISDDTQDEAERAYLDYLYSIMDEDAVVEATKNIETAINPEGILYMTASSSSGSKYYDLVQRQQTYIAARWQGDVPTYSVISMDETSFTINTYRTDTNEAIDKQFTIVKSVSKNVLEEEIMNIENLALNSNDYTKNSWEVFAAALEGAKSVVDDAKADSDTVANALAVLKSAYASLEKAEDNSVENTEQNEEQAKAQNNSVSQPNPEQTQSKMTDTQKNEPVKTGDTTDVMVYIILGLTCVAAFSGVIMIKKKKVDTME